MTLHTSGRGMRADILLMKLRIVEKCLSQKCCTPSRMDSSCKDNSITQLLLLRFLINEIVFLLALNPIDFPHLNLRWYGTPCNIFKDDRILKNDYNHAFKNFKIYDICPQNAFIKYHKRDKK